MNEEKIRLDSVKKYFESFFGVDDLIIKQMTYSPIIPMFSIYRNNKCVLGSNYITMTVEAWEHFAHVLKRFHGNNMKNEYDNILQPEFWDRDC